jgi:hypothetical protein
MSVGRRPQCGWKVRLSENGPREGTRDLPRRSPDAGSRSPEGDSPAGAAYKKLAGPLGRRRAELVAFAEEGGATSDIAKAYEAVHPLEPTVTSDEVANAVRKAKARASDRSRGEGLLALDHTGFVRPPSWSNPAARTVSPEFRTTIGASSIAPDRPEVPVRRTAPASTLVLRSPRTGTETAPSGFGFLGRTPR